MLHPIVLITIDSNIDVDNSRNETYRVILCQRSMLIVQGHLLLQLNIKISVDSSLLLHFRLSTHPSVVPLFYFLETSLDWLIFLGTTRLTHTNERAAINTTIEWIFLY